MARRPSRAPSYDELVTRMAVIHERLREARVTVATAESCTGGLLAAVLCEHGGSSDYYLGGAVVYSDSAKTVFVDVPSQLIHGHGAVSSVVAAALARGARDRLAARIGLGITGVAGPGGGTASKPVGLVYVAIESERLSTVRSCHWTFDRAGNRLASVGAALDLLERCVA